jgi:large subunit ribosomal protein L18
MRLDKKRSLLQKRRWRIRRKVRGTAEQPRLTVHFSHKHIVAQVIDDEAGKTLLYLSTLSKDLADKKLSANSASATELGKILGERAKGKGIGQVVFDRAGRRYHGCVKAFADAAREGGLSF